MSQPPIKTKDKPDGLRQRQRCDGTWRVWWEPSKTRRDKGQKPVELSAERPTWSIREAKRLNEQGQTSTGTTRKTVRRGAQRRTGGRTMDALIKLYEVDDEFLDLAESTRAGYRGQMSIISRKWGAHLVTSFAKPVVRKWYKTNQRERGETQAVRLNAMLSILFSYAELHGWRSEGSNPAFRLKMRTPTPRARIGTWDEIYAIWDAADQLELPQIKWACAIAVLHGQRQTDIREARIGAFQQVTPQLPDGTKADNPIWAWAIKRSKRGSSSLLPLHPMVADMIGTRLSKGDPETRLLINPRTRAAYTMDSFVDHWNVVWEEAAYVEPSILNPDKLQFRDLRRTFSVWSRMAGTDKSDLGDVLGNSAARNPALQNTYMPPVLETSGRAITAIVPPPKKQKRKRA